MFSHPRPGLISNVAGCNAAFNVVVLRCPSGPDEGDQCLSDLQINAANTIASPTSPGYGVTLPGFSHGLGPVSATYDGLEVFRAWRRKAQP